MTYANRSRGRKARIQERKREEFQGALTTAVHHRRGELWDEAFRRGAQRMREDMTRLDVVETERIKDGPRYEVRAFVKFPDPEKDHPPHMVAMMPFVPGPLLGGPLAELASQRMRQIPFQRVTNALECATDHGRARLIWYTWEPTRHHEEGVQRTKVLFKGLSFLHQAEACLRSFTQPICLRCNAPLPRAFNEPDALGYIVLARKELSAILGNFEARSQIDDVEARSQWQRGIRGYV